MANTTTVDILEIQTGNSVKSVAGLKEEIKNLKNELLNLDKGTEEYNQKLVELGDKTHDYKQLMSDINNTNNDFGTQVANASKAVAGMTGAVSAVTGTLSLLGIETGKDTEIMKTLMSAMSVTQGLQAMASGVLAVKALGKSLGLAKTAQEGFNKAALKNPYIIMGAVIVAAVGGVIAAIHRQKEAEKEQHEKRMSQLREQAEENNKLKLAEQKLYENAAMFRVRAGRMNRQELEDELKRLREANEEVMAGIEADNIEIRRMEKEIPELEKQLKKQGVNVKELTWENAETEDKIQLLSLKEEKKGYVQNAQALKQLNDEYVTKIRIIKELLPAAKVEIKNDYDTASATKHEVEALKEVNTEYEKRNHNIDLAIAQGEKEEVVLNKRKEAEEGLLSGINSVLEAETEKLSSMKESDQGYNEQVALVESLTQRHQKQETVVAKLKKEIDDFNKKEALKNIQTRENNALLDENIRYLNKQVELEKLQNNSAESNPNTFKGIEENAERAMALNNEWYENEKKNIEENYNAQIEAWENEMALDSTTPERKEELNKLIVEAKAKMNLKLLQLEEQYNANDVDITKKAIEDKLALYKMYTQTVESIVGQLTSIISSVSDVMEQGTKEWKSLKIAETIISTLAGAASALSVIWTEGHDVPGYTAKLAVGIATAAAVMANGFAQVQKIKNTKVSKSGAGSTPSSVVVQSISNTPTNVRQTSPMWRDEEYIGEQIQETNQDQTVTLVYSDLENMSRRSTNISTNNTI